MDSRGFKKVKIYVSGGLDDESVKVLSAAGADGFGVGTSVSNAPSIDFAMDIVEAGGKSVAKRGKFGGRKEVWRCDKCLLEYVTLQRAPSPTCSNCGGKTTRLLKKLLESGRLSETLPKPDAIRGNVIRQLVKLTVN